MKCLFVPFLLRMFRSLVVILLTVLVLVLALPSLPALAQPVDSLKARSLRFMRAQMSPGIGLAGSFRLAGVYDSDLADNARGLIDFSRSSLTTPSDTLPAKNLLMPCGIFRNPTTDGGTPMIPVTVTSSTMKNPWAKSPMTAWPCSPITASAMTSGRWPRPGGPPNGCSLTAIPGTALSARARP